jgi:hypothetical protein
MPHQMSLLAFYVLKDRYVLCATLIQFQESKKEYFAANIFLFEKHLSLFLIYVKFCQILYEVLVGSQ